MGDDVYDIPGFMAAVSADFGRHSRSMKKFDNLYSLYRKRRDELTADPSAPEDLTKLLTHSAVKVGYGLVRSAPGGHVLTEFVSSDDLISQIDALRAFVVSKLRDSSEVELVLSPVTQLSRTFVDQLATIAKRRPVCLFIDTYERLGSFLDNWVLDLLDGHFGETSTNLTFVISGQAPLDASRWSKYLGVLRSLRLAPFTEDECQRFLLINGIKDQRIIEVIYGLTGGMPLWAAALAANTPTSSEAIGDPSGDAADRFLKWETDEDRRKEIITAAIPRWLNEDVVSIALNVPDSHSSFRYLCRLPFVSSNGGRARYHDVVRSAMVRLSRRQSPDHWHKQHLALAEAHWRWQQALELQVGEGWRNENWQQHAIELTYHRLCFDPKRALVGAFEDGVQACEVDEPTARRWSEMIQQAAHDTDDPAVLVWARRLSGAKPGADGDERIHVLTQLLDHGLLAEATQSRARVLRAIQFFKLGDENNAIADLDRVARSGYEQAWALKWRGHICRLSGHVDQALTDFSQAAELDPNDIYSVKWRGWIYQRLRRQKEAIRDFAAIIERYPADIEVVRWRAESYMGSKQFDLALADYERVLQAEPGDKGVLAKSAIALAHLGRLNEALPRMDRVTAEVEPFDRAYIRHLIFASSGYEEQEVAELDAMRVLRPNDGLVHHSYAMMFAGRDNQDAWAASLSHFDRAIEADDRNVEAIAFRGAAYMELGHADKALIEFTRSLAVSPKYAIAHYFSAMALEKLNRVPEAIVELDHALLADPFFVDARLMRDSLLSSSGSD